MTRRECLDKAAECVLHDRASQYGGPENNFGRIAKLWSTYTGTVLDGIDVAMMMALLKVARIRNNKGYEDGYIDLAGYAACGAELAGAQKAREDATRRWGAEYKKLRAEAEGDAKAEGCEEPEFKPGDHLILTYPNGDERSCVYVGESLGETAFCLVRYDDDGTTDDVPVDELRCVPKRAEGCEELVQKDAPQTPQELYKRIVANNPATFKARTPTGEELAEMAKEEKRG